ncbi:putative ATP-dependent DNA ligase [Burkholderia phage Bp-AMP4]|uniref:Putative ATP-dependent DNA ligase n=1 Tax=Burkholderia phage Bp-AMP4 TaxID=1437329 RepID=A0A0A8KWN9_9CAUD|nr:putative ATP-dependent DNA ligase [Burkholderia phage Bp-AMP4]
MTQYIIQKAVEFSAVKVAVRKEWGVESVDDLSGRFYLQRKYDGCNGIVKLTPNAAGDVVLSRTGEVAKSCDHIIKAARRTASGLLERGVAVALLGEVWKPKTEFAEISGMFRRHNAEPSLQFVAFDMLMLDEFAAGASFRRFEDRYNALHVRARGAHPTDTIQLAATYLPGSYGSAVDFATRLVAEGGYDGAILRDPDGLWAAGGGTTGEIIKVKAAESHDLRVVGVEEGKGKYKGTLGALVCQGPRGHLKVSGMTDAQRDEWWANPESVIGQIIEVQCLGFTNGLRALPWSLAIP